MAVRRPSSNRVPSGRRSPGKPTDAGYRYGELWLAPHRPLQLRRATVAWMARLPPDLTDRLQVGLPEHHTAVVRRVREAFDRIPSVVSSVVTGASSGSLRALGSGRVLEVDGRSVAFGR